MQLIESEKIYSWVGKNDAVSMAYVELQISAENADSTTGNY